MTPSDPDGGPAGRGEAFVRMSCVRSKCLPIWESGATETAFTECL
jgi:hypothetical protein